MHEIQHQHVRWGAPPYNLKAAGMYSWKRLVRFSRFHNDPSTFYWNQVPCERERGVYAISFDDEALKKSSGPLWSRFAWVFIKKSISSGPLCVRRGANTENHRDDGEKILEVGHSTEAGKSFPFGSLGGERKSPKWFYYAWKWKLNNNKSFGRRTHFSLSVSRLRGARRKCNFFYYRSLRRRRRHIHFLSKSFKTWNGFRLEKC